MRKKNTQKLSNVIEQLLTENNLSEKLYQRRVLNAWEEVLGKNISTHTTNLYFHNQQLHATISSSVLRHELFLMRYEIKNRLNRHVGKNIIQEIRLH